MAGGTACPTFEDAGFVVVAQAVPPALPILFHSFSGVEFS
jgi:hypothetical protein